MKRRELVGGLVALVGGAAAGLGARAHGEARLRPPGAGSEDELAHKCIRCFRCAEVCPVDAIRFDSVGRPLVADVPYLDARERGCVLCMACTQACPTGALRPIPFDRVIVQREVRMGTARVDTHRCIAWTASGVCRACYYVCPYQDEAITLRGPMQAPHIEPERCTGCGLCEEACPERARAIRVIPAGEGVS